MKKIYLFLILLITPISMAANSPMHPGSIHISGSSSYSKFGGDAYRDSKVFMINTEIGFCIAKNFFFSPGVVYSHFQTESYVYYGFNEYRLEDVSYSSWGLSPSFEYYFTGDQLIKKGANIPYLSLLANFDDDHIRQYGGAFGVLLFISNSVSINLSFQFTIDKSESSYTGYPYYNTEDLTGQTILIGIGFSSFIY